MPCPQQPPVPFSAILIYAKRHIVTLKQRTRRGSSVQKPQLILRFLLRCGLHWATPSSVRRCARFRAPAPSCLHRSKRCPFLLYILPKLAAMDGPASSILLPCLHILVMNSPQGAELLLSRLHEFRNILILFWFCIPVCQVCSHTILNFKILNLTKFTS